MQLVINFAQFLGSFPSVLLRGSVCAKDIATNRAAISAARFYGSSCKSVLVFECFYFLSAPRRSGHGRAALLGISSLAHVTFL